MRPAFKVSKREALQTHILFINEGRVDKTKHKSHQTCALFINVRVMFTNQTHAFELRIDYSTSNDVKGMNPFEFNNGKSHFYLKLGLPKEKYYPLEFEATMTLEEEAVCLPFRAISMVETLKKD